MIKLLSVFVDITLFSGLAHFTTDEFDLMQSVVVRNKLSLRVYSIPTRITRELLLGIYGIET